MIFIKSMDIETNNASQDIIENSGLIALMMIKVLLSVLVLLSFVG